MLFFPNLYNFCAVQKSCYPSYIHFFSVHANLCVQKSWKLTCPGFELAAPLAWWYDIVIIALDYQLSSICSLQLLYISILWLWQILFGNTYIFLYCFLIVLWLVLFICSFDCYRHFLTSTPIICWPWVFFSDC